MILRQTIFRHHVGKQTAVLQKLFSQSLYKSHDENEDTEGEVFNIEQCTAIINGGASGIGLAIAKEFLQKGQLNQTVL